MPVVSLFLRLDLYCLLMVECCFRGFHSEEMGCSMLFAYVNLDTAAASMALWLLVPSVHGLLQTLFSCVLQFCHVVFSFLGLTATLKCHFFPHL